VTVLAALGQIAHLRSDDGEALAVLAHPRRRDHRGRRQQVGLAGDGVDDADRVRDLLHRLAGLASSALCGKPSRACSAFRPGGRPSGRRT